MNYFLKYT